MVKVREQQRRLEEVRKDFEVRYRFFTQEEGGRKSPPAQPYRSDWIYEGDYPVDRLFMIWPIFIDEVGRVREPGLFVPAEGMAQMFIVDDELRLSLHSERLKPGVKGYFMEGPHRVAEATVTRMLALASG